MSNTVVKVLGFSKSEKYEGLNVLHTTCEVVDSRLGLPVTVRRTYTCLFHDWLSVYIGQTCEIELVKSPLTNELCIKSIRIKEVA